MLYDISIERGITAAIIKIGDVEACVTSAVNHLWDRPSSKVRSSVPALCHCAPVRPLMANTNTEGVYI